MIKKENVLFLLLGMALFYISTFLDKSVSLLFQTIKIPFLDLIFSIITNFGVVLVFLLFMPAIMVCKKDKKTFKLLFLTFFLSFVLSFVLKLTVLRQRPTDTLYYPIVNIINYSFPSTHSMVIFALLPLLLSYLPKQKAFWLSFTFLVGFSRIYLNFHYLSDVVFGAVFGYFIGRAIIEFYVNKPLKNEKQKSRNK